MSDDPYREPDNSTVDDWFGQSVARDQELADAISEEAGTEKEAEEEFAKRSHGAEEQAARHEGRDR